MNETKLRTGWAALLVIYLVAIAISAFTGIVLLPDGLLTASFWAAMVSMVVVFAGSVVMNNSSMFDPWWSVAPPLLALFYWLGSAGAGQEAYDVALLSQGENVPRILLIFILLLIYGIRLTWNFLRGWKGLSHEDWRYADFRRNTGRWYWLVSFAGIHFFPSLMVFAGSLSLWVSVSLPVRAFGWPDILAGIITLGAILLEAIADQQLRRHVRSGADPEKTMDKGLWAWSRHPNYLGEILFWWGLYLFALAANPTEWLVIAGPVVITLMFLFISIPLIERRMIKRRSDYGEYSKKVSKLWPLPPR